MAREDALSFDRKPNYARDVNRHGLSYEGIFTRMIAIYQAEIFVFCVLLGYFMYLVVELNAATVKAFPVVLELGAAAS